MSAPLPLPLLLPLPPSAPKAPGGKPTTAQPDAAKTYHHAMRAR